jgi:repressor LexA
MTERQKMVLDFIELYIKMKGFPPSYMDIATGLNLRSKSNIHRLVHDLKDKGLLQIKPHMVRSLKVVDKTVKEVIKL